MDAMAKWMGFYSPLFFGRFDFGLGETAPRADSFVNFTWLGRFWTRLQGGYNLRRSTNGKIPELTDPIVGTTDGSAETISDLAWMNHHAASSRFIYRLSAVGGGGVEDGESDPVTREVIIKADGTLATAIPNAPLSIDVIPQADGSFILRWRYSGRGEQVAPVNFYLYHNSGNGGEVSHASSFANTPYVAGQENYEYTTGVLAGSSQQLWRFGVRAGTSSTVMEKNTISGEAFNRTTAPYGLVTPIPVGGTPQRS